MALDDAIKTRASELLAESGALTQLGNEHGQVNDPGKVALCKGWIAAAHNIVHQICEGTSTPYLKAAEGIIQSHGIYQLHKTIGELAILLKHLMADAENGLISSVAERASAETFDNFLDHGEEYLKLARKNEAGVVVGVVFEDSIRRVCQKVGIAQKGQKLDNLISALASAGLLSGVKAKRAPPQAM